MSFAHRIIRLDKDVEKIPEDHNPLVVSAELMRVSSACEDQDLSWPRASSLYSMCIRQNVIGTVDQARVKKWTSVASRVTYGIGNALHFWMQNSPDLFGDKRRGWWRCLACRRVVGFGGPPKKRCRFCNAYPEAIVYYEHEIRIEGNPVYFTGHVDMFLFHHNVLRTTELKSLNGDKWDKLVAPYAEHEWQLQSYMWTLPQDKRIPIPIDPSVGYLAYVSKKQTSGHLPVKIYPVKRSDAVVNRVVESLDIYKKGLESFPRYLPEVHTECSRSNFTSYRAKQCPVRVRCTELLDGA